jgi:ribonuclease BN (tRNA processing enzyme)
VRHYPRGIAFGYRLQWEGRTIVYSGDTEWTDELAEYSRDADLFICECSSFEEKIEYHMSYRELEAHRANITARRSLLVHAGDDVLAHRRDMIFELAEEGLEVHL